MPKLNKKIIALCLLVGGLGALGAAVLPTADELRPLWDDLAITLQRPLYDEQRRQLALHLPGFFPLKLTCLYQPKNGDWRTVLPGDLVQGWRGGASLTCTNGDKFHLHPDSAARFWARRGNQTFLEVERGWVSGVAVKQPIRIGLASAEVDFRPRGAARFLATAKGKEEAYLKCLSGYSQLAVSRRVDEPLLLESGVCRVDVQRAGEAERFTMAAGERVFLADLALPFPARPDLPPLKGLAPIEAEAEGADAALDPISLTIAAAPDGKPQINATSATALDDCDLFTYRPGAEPRELKTYPRLEKSFTAELPNAARAPLFLECKSANGTRVSNFLTSLKIAEAPADSAPAPPAVINAPAPASTPVPVAKARAAIPPAKARTPKRVLQAPPPKK